MTPCQTVKHFYCLEAKTVVKKIIPVNLWVRWYNIGDMEEGQVSIQSARSGLENSRFVERVRSENKIIHNMRNTLD